ncbi:hypothetical protein Tco_1390669, partial [Tanacetum coccineum]
SYKDDKDQAGSSKQGKSSSKPSKSNKPVDADEVIHDVETDTRECVEDAVCDSSPTAPVINKTKWFKQSPRPATPKSPDPDWSKGQNADTEPLQNWFLELEKTAKAPTDFDDVLGSTFDFLNFIKYRLKNDTLTKADLEVEFFFNQDLEYLRTGILEERKDTASLTKTKATRQAKQSDHIVYSRMKILSIVIITMEKYCGYGYLKEIVVKKVNQKEYVFKKADLPSLHLNDIEDMFLLYYQNKLHHLDGKIQTDLAVALWFFIRRTVIKHRVEDVQLGVESYQTKLNLTKPQVSAPGVDRTEPYTIFYKPRGVTYESRNGKRCLMREDEVCKFGDATLTKVRDELRYRLTNSRFGYYKDMPTRPWSDKDKKHAMSMVKVIEKTLHRRRIIKSLECYAGGRNHEADHRLLTRTD